MDKLLELFFEKERWETAIETAVDKKINKGRLKTLCTTQKRIELLEKIANHSYNIAPPHMAQIPKDNGDMRTVYINEDIDRIILSIINQLFFDTCEDMISDKCKSYQKGIGCGKIVRQLGSKINQIQSETFGVKLDLSKYFDSVDLKYIKEVFEKIRERVGESCIIDMVEKYYESNDVIDMNKTLIEKYTSLKQGSAVASFLADAILYDIDELIGNLNRITYVRYSDDILIIGEENDVMFAYDLLRTMLEAKELNINPKKTEILKKNRWFKFLGFMLKGDSISLSQSRVKTFQKEIEKRTIKSKERTYKQLLHNINNYLYKGEYSWCGNVLTAINNEKDINTLNTFVMDAIRAAVTGKTRIGGLGTTFEQDDCTIIRGKGKNVKANRQKLSQLSNYKTLLCMKKVYITHKPCYEAITRLM